MPTLQMSVLHINGTPEDREKLPQIIREHKEWLEDHTKGRKACLKEMYLKEADFSGLDLSFVDLSGACLEGAKLVGTILTGAVLNGVSLGQADFTRAKLDDAQMSQVHAFDDCFEEASMKGAILRRSILWGSNFKVADLSLAVMTGSELCDCTFESADLTGADLAFTDLDNAVFKNAILKYARVEHAVRSYWADFTGADVTGVEFSGCELDEEFFEGAIGFHPHMRCPEEGSFIAWKKCRDDRIVKLLIPETAKRTGASTYCCRASEARVLEIWDRDGEPCAKAVSHADEDFIYRKGETVYPKKTFDDHLLEDGSGIHFFLTRTEAEQFEFRNDDDDDEENEEE